jgi:hypothetical protein
VGRATATLLLITMVAAGCGGDDRAVDPAAPTTVNAKVDDPGSDPCLQTVACHVFGQCSTGPGDSGVCVVATDADCRGSLFCANTGHCSRLKTTDGYRCLPGKNADCQQSHGCLQFGQCSWFPDHTCR